MPRTVLALCAAAAALVLGPVRPAGAESWQLGTASWYGTESCPRDPRLACLTATGERFNQWGMTVAVPYRWQLGATYTIQNRANGRSVVVRANDICPACAGLGRAFDLTRGVRDALGGGDLVSIRYAIGAFATDQNPVPDPAPVLLATEWYVDDGLWVEKQTWAVGSQTVDTFDVFGPAS